MKIFYDVEVDAIYIEIKSLIPGTAENRELADDIIANYSSDGKLAGLEILNASMIFGEKPSKVVVEVSLCFTLKPLDTR